MLPVMLCHCCSPLTESLVSTPDSSRVFQGIALMLLLPVAYTCLCLQSPLTLLQNPHNCTVQLTGAHALVPAACCCFAYTCLCLQSPLTLLQKAKCLVASYPFWPDYGLLECLANDTTCTPAPTAAPTAAV